jgi:hypothetical protein
MPKICYTYKNFSPAGLATITTANEILEEYAAQGFDLTLRQLYYQFVARGFIPNKDAEYKKLGGVVSDARLAGLIDWDYIVDRTRNMRQNGHWSSPQSIIESCARAYQINKWAEQPNYVEVWIEKDALVGVIQGVCGAEDVPYFSCRGYTSQSEMWSAAMRLVNCQREGRKCHIIHLGDHDPSGIDMTRDIRDRLRLFCAGHSASWHITVHRIALNMDQVQEYNPPPNPAKVTDSRSGPYIDKYGDESWELDALEPSVLVGLIRDKINDLRDPDIWDGACRAEAVQRETLGEVHRQWAKVVKLVKK